MPLGEVRRERWVWQWAGLAREDHIRKSEYRPRTGADQEVGGRGSQCCHTERTALVLSDDRIITCGGGGGALCPLFRRSTVNVHVCM